MKSGWIAVSVSLLLLSGCGDDADILDAGANTDTGTEHEDTSTGIDTEGIVGRVWLATTGWGGVYGAEAQVGAAFYDGVMRFDAFSAFPPGLHIERLRQGACVLYAAADSACNPPCGADKYCNASSACETTPANVSAGTVTVQAGGASAALTLEDLGFLIYNGSSVPASAIGVDQTITASAPGDTFPAFSLTVTGAQAPVFAVDLMGNSLTLEDGKDNVLTWTPSGSGGTVQLLLNTGWHAAPPEATLLCEVDEEAGELVIPRAIVEAFPNTGGIGHEPHGSYISVLRRARNETSLGLVELVVAARHGTYPRHNDSGGGME